MLKGIYDAQCGFNRCKHKDVPAIIDKALSTGSDIDTVHKLSYLYQKTGAAQEKPCKANGSPYKAYSAESSFGLS